MVKVLYGKLQGSTRFVEMQICMQKVLFLEFVVLKFAFNSFNPPHRFWKNVILS